MCRLRLRGGETCGSTLFGSRSRKRHKRREKRLRGSPPFYAYFRWRRGKLSRRFDMKTTLDPTPIPSPGVVATATTDTGFDSQLAVVDLPFPQPQHAPRITGYAVSTMLGEGGMGSVWRAEQLSTRRDVALKVLGLRLFASERTRLRFDREVELTAKLEHPNIARIYDSGVDHGVYFYAMELIDGVELDTYVKDHKLARAAAVADANGLRRRAACASAA